jgi:signal transduction histidine kinase
LWLRPPRSLLIVLTAITAGSSVALGWLTWEVLRREEAVAAQYEAERVALDADGAVQAMVRALGDAEAALDEHLTAAAPTPSNALDGGTAVIFDKIGVAPIAPARLLFYPTVAARPEAPDAIFDEGERAEFQQRDLRAATRIYERMAATPEPTVRAAALMRLARVQVKAGALDKAMDAYEQLSNLVDVAVSGLPADLVARNARSAILIRLGRRDAGRAAREAIARDLVGGRWRLTRGQFDHFIEESGAADRPGIPPAHLTAAETVDALWRDWQAGSAAAGRRLRREGDLSVLVLTRSGNGRLAGWVAPAAALLARVSLDPAVQLGISDAGGYILAGAPQHSRSPLVRAPAETGLPWSVHVSRRLATASGGLSRGHLAALGLGIMLAFLLAGAYFVGRAIQHEVTLRRQQADFVSAVSHEFRTPLAAMRQLSELLAAGRVPSEERRHSYYESLAGESRRLQHLVEQLLDFGRLEAGARPMVLEPLEPRALVEQVVAAFQSQLARPACRIELAGDESSLVLADRAALSLALHNLLDNAVKYAGADGPIRVQWAARGGRVAISVRDQGPGIAAEERVKIFEKFVRGAAATKGLIPGTGIGLAMVQLVANSHGGDVTVDSQPGTGATFTLLLPAASAS